MIKIFWSWQSDHPGKISRHFVREALEQAIHELNADADVEEAERNISLDHDRKGVPGSPPLAETILAKIRDSHVFVADVTPIGSSDSDSSKKLMNSNVAIELGYAFSAVGDQGLIMVLNGHFGNRDDLPFDLRHKAGPVIYYLSPEADKERQKAEKSKLVGTLKEAIRTILDNQTASTSSAFEEAKPADDSPARFFVAGEILEHRGVGSSDVEQKFFGPNGPLLYLRLIPTQATNELKRSEAVQLIRLGLEPLRVGVISGCYNGQNKYGSIAFAADNESGEILAGSQLFLNREIWSFNNVLVRHRKNSPDGIPTKSVEQAFAFTLPSISNFAEKKLGLAPPFIFEAGAYPISGYSILMPGNYIEPSWGPIQVDHVYSRHQLKTTDSATIDLVLLRIFEDFFDAGGCERPKGLYHFPGDQPGQLPR